MGAIVALAVPSVHANESMKGFTVEVNVKMSNEVSKKASFEPMNNLAVESDMTPSEKDGKKNADPTAHLVKNGDNTAGMVAEVKLTGPGGESKASAGPDVEGKTHNHLSSVYMEILGSGLKVDKRPGVHDFVKGE